ncbi:hypothetical protein HNR00_003809 [Methylorubrum rhodinum]|uniref:DUF3306 domain-containing protein n=1 Tax=Methylorubrum rhodinum TaxID=29428 RepID=A0A840ZQC0_9HYPH|nr:DUF3306 domain-containing protein [Methylorubrum rhodinum]MBB5759081.1 hypothetical protein [Methylorubrum rhodinum]
MSDGFLSRWARRKEAVKAAEQNVAQEAPVPSPLWGGVGVGVVQDEAGAVPPAPPPPPPSSPQGGGEAPDLEALGDRTAASEVPADTDQHLLDLPSLDALTPDTDLTPFLRTGVPSALRNAALRRMWSLDPSIRDFVSEAREYAYDWNTPGGVPGMGPLLPGDDVKAMLGRLFRDPAEAKPEAGSPADAPEPEPTESPETGVAEAADEVPAPEPEPAQASIVSAEPPQPKAAEAPRPEPRLRRHGGAKPA